MDPRVTKYVGLSIICGFTVMLLLDQGFLILQEKQAQKPVTHHEEKHEEVGYK